MLSNCLNETHGGDSHGKRSRLTISCAECHRRKQKCDRLQPCANCSKREKPHLCIYEYLQHEQGAHVHRASSHASSASLNLQAISDPPAAPYLTSCDKHISDDLGYSLDAPDGTLGLIRLAKAQDSFIGSHQGHKDREGRLPLHYKNYIRQLPPQKYIQALAQSFFTDIAWYYDIIDEDSFYQQLHCWNMVPYSIVTQDPSKLPPDLHPFLALLFQILAQALLLLPLHASDSYQDLKHRPDMSFADLAAEYSEAGHEILVSLGTKCKALSKIQAGLLRASFQKSTGSVMEAWHILGATIRDAQEVGLHQTRSAHASVAAMSSSIEHLRDLEIRTRLWLALHLWDGHMAVVLGRPMSTRVDHDVLISLLDRIGAAKKKLPEEFSNGCKRLESFTFILEGYRAAYRYLQDIHDLDSSDLSRVDKYRTVETIHRNIVQNMRRLPDCVKVDSGESNRQGESLDLWLPAARETLFTELHFVILALHRPYIFSVPRSREEAHNAALRVLTSQSRLFNMSALREYQPFNLIFATFDAMVLIEADCVLFPQENGSRLDASVNNIQWGLQRLDGMRTKSQLAASAYNVVQSLYQRMMSRLHPESYPAPSSNEMQIPHDMQGNMACLFSHIPQGGVVGVPPSPTPEQIYAFQPLQPLHDLILQSSPSNDWQQMQPATCLWPQQQPLQNPSGEDFRSSPNELEDNYFRKT